MHTMDKETAITEARQRFKAWRCRPEFLSVPPLNPQRTNFDFEPIVSSHRLAIPFPEGYCIQPYKKLTKEQKTFICGGRLAYVFLGKKKSPAAMQGFSNEVIREEENDPV